MSTFSGLTNEIPWLSIDEFTGPNLKSTCFLLSHCHSDHMKGINEFQFINHLQKNPKVFLYCSEITAAILKYHGLASVMHKIVELPIHGATVIKVPIPDDDSPGTEVSVTMLPAGHCPGSVMFLLEGSWGNVLYTGDFRLARGDCRKLKALHDSSGRVKQIASLYVDTTFIALCDDADLHFPSREESADNICRLIGEWLKKGKNNVVNLKTSAKWGSEFLILKIAKAFNTQIHVSSHLYDVYRHIPDIEYAVTNDCSSTRIHCCWHKGKQNLPPCLRQSDVRTIKPAAMWWYCNQSREKPMTMKSGQQWNGRSDFWRVFYACHSSHREIVDLVTYLKPARIEPCVVPDSATRQQVVDLCNKLLVQYQPKRMMSTSTELPAAKVSRLWQSEDEATTEDDSPTTSPKRCR